MSTESSLPLRLAATRHDATNRIETPTGPVAKSALNGRIDHVDLAEHVGLGVTVDTRIGARERRRKPPARHHS